MALSGLSESRREAVMTWLTANQITPSDVPLDAIISTSTAPDGTRAIHYSAVRRDTDGKIQTDADGWIFHDPYTTALIVEPPEGFALPNLVDWEGRARHLAATIARVQHLADVWDDAPDPLAQAMARDLRTTLNGPKEPTT